MLHFLISVTSSPKKSFKGSIPEEEVMKRKRCYVRSLQNMSNPISSVRVPKNERESRREEKWIKRAKENEKRDLRRERERE